MRSSINQVINFLKFNTNSKILLTGNVFVVPTASSAKSCRLWSILGNWLVNNQHDATIYCDVKIDQEPTKPAENVVGNAKTFPVSEILEVVLKFKIFNYLLFILYFHMVIYKRCLKDIIPKRFQNLNNCKNMVTKDIFFFFSLV